MTIRFKKCNGFDECEQDFIYKSTKAVKDLAGQSYPLRIIELGRQGRNYKQDHMSITDEKDVRETPNQQSSQKNMNPITSNLKEMHGTDYIVRKILSILSLKLDSSFSNGFPSPKVLSTSHKYIVHSTMSVSVDCTLQEMEKLKNSIESINGFTREGFPSNNCSFPELIRLSVFSFSNLAKIFLIEEDTQRRLLYKSKLGRNGNIVSCIYIGFFQSGATINDPCLLSIGGQYEAGGVGMVLGRRHLQQNMDQFKSKLRVVKEGEIKNYLGEGSGMNSNLDFIGFTWKSLIKQSITNVHKRRDEMYGILEINLPLVQVRHSLFAREIDSIMEKCNGTQSSSDDCSSSSESE